MKARLYFILIFLSDVTALFNVYGRADNSFDRLRVMYLEKTSFKEFSFDPFPLFIMLSYTFNVILSVYYVMSNSHKFGNVLILSRFVSCGSYFAFLFFDTFKRVILCAFIQSVIPLLICVPTISAWNVERAVTLAVMYFIVQTVMLCYGVFLSLLTEKKLKNAAEIIGALFILLLAIIDTFTNSALVLIDLSDVNPAITAAEIIVFSVLSALCYLCFKKGKIRLDERL